MAEPTSLKLVVATFATDAGAARALATLVPGLGPESIGRSAIVSKGPARASGRWWASSGTPASRTTT